MITEKYIRVQTMRMLATFELMDVGETFRLRLYYITYKTCMHRLYVFVPKREDLVDYTTVCYGFYLKYLMSDSVETERIKQTEKRKRQPCNHRCISKHLYPLTKSFVLFIKYIL